MFGGPVDFSRILCAAKTTHCGFQHTEALPRFGIRGHILVTCFRGVEPAELIDLFGAQIDFQGIVHLGQRILRILLAATQLEGGLLMDNWSVTRAFVFAGLVSGALGSGRTPRMLSDTRSSRLHVSPHT